MRASHYGSFDYPPTCTRIDHEIGEIKQSIAEFLYGLLEEACPLIDYYQRKELAAHYSARLYGDIENSIEAVRETNEDMRKEADRQVAALVDSIDMLKDDLASLEQTEEK